MLSSRISVTLRIVELHDDVRISRAVLTRWAESCLRMNHIGTLLQREMEGQTDRHRALDLAERARRRAWALFNELIENGARKPEGYCEPEEDSEL